MIYFKENKGFWSIQYIKWWEESLIPLSTKVINFTERHWTESDLRSSRRVGWGKQTGQQYGLTLFHWNQWQKVERMLLKWLQSWTSNTETVLCFIYCLTVGTCCPLWLYFSRSKRSIL